MTPEIYKLYTNHSPLPKGTKLEDMSGQYEPLSDTALRAANQVPNHLSDDVPFWILGWTDLHERLLGVNEREN